MKKNILSVLAICAALFSCQKNEFSEPLSSGGDLHATIEDVSSTKTYMDADNNIRWSENDQIVAFMKSSYGHKYQVKPSFVGKTYADFSKISSSTEENLSAGVEWDHNVAYYPYAESVECVKSGNDYTLDVILPAEQTYAAESFGNGFFPMVAVSSDYDITFKNVCGGVKLLLKGTQKVASIRLQGKNSEKLSGAATLTAYADPELKPAITMASGASTFVTLNCGDGIQLNESTATEFIISLPPVLFSKGFVVTVTDVTGREQTIETDNSNEVKRSVLLVMPEVTVGTSGEEEDELKIPVMYIALNLTSTDIITGDAVQLVATVKPRDATSELVWNSSNSSVATVDQTGLVVAISAGNSTITASADGIVASCNVTVLDGKDYVDEYGVNHGHGVLIDRVCWAPVNCGYHKDDYKYGKLYQWGRKYGQGYDGNLYNLSGSEIGTYSDATVPTIEEGGISAITGQHKSKSNVFFTGTSEYNSDWLYPQDSKLWNSGTESNPVKTDYDPCPQGWRVPTYAELSELRDNHSSWTTDENGQVGRWFSGASAYTEQVPQVFFPAAGLRYYLGGDAYSRGRSGYYWSSRPYSDYAYDLYFGRGYIDMYDDRRVYGYSVRCVQVTDEVAEL